MTFVVHRFNIKSLAVTTCTHMFDPYSSAVVPIL